MLAKAREGEYPAAWRACLFGEKGENFCIGKHAPWEGARSSMAKNFGELNTASSNPIDVLIVHLNKELQQWLPIKGRRKATAYSYEDWFPGLTERINDLQQKTARIFMPWLVQMQELAVRYTAVSLIGVSALNMW